LPTFANKGRGIPPDGNDSVDVNWTNAAEAWYIIEVELGPEFSDRNAQNNEATRAILVGDQCFVVDDFDCDGVHDLYDNCPMTCNPDQADDDGDGVGNACDGCAENECCRIILVASPTVLLLSYF